MERDWDAELKDKSVTVSESVIQAKVDYLYLREALDSAGVPHVTSEGLDLAFALLDRAYQQEAPDIVVRRVSDGDPEHAESEE